ncbi:MAG: type IV secretion system DNA-binding domain-containing protein [Candidatus Methanomethylicaceae archaeon]
MEKHVTAYAVIPPRDSKTDLLAIENLFAGLHNVKQSTPIAFELWGEPARLRLIIRSPDPSYAEFTALRLRSIWPNAVIVPLYDNDDPAFILERDPAHARTPLVAELRFREPAYLPIRTHISREGRSTYDDLSRQADPLAEVLTALSQMQEDEYAAVQYAIRPIHDAWGRLWRGSEQDIAKRLSLTPPHVLRKVSMFLGGLCLLFGSFFLLLSFLSRGVSISFMLVLASILSGLFFLLIALRIPPPPRPEIVAQKIASTGFLARIRVFVWSSPARAHLLMNQILSSFGGYGFPAGNAFVSRTLSSKELILNINVPNTRLETSTLFLSSLISPKWQLPILSSAELSYLWHIPHQSTYIPKLEYASSRLIAPTSRDFLNADNGIPIGKDALMQKAVYLPFSAFKGHIGLIGASQSGKTNMMIQLASALLSKDPNASLVVIDPHGTLARGLLQHIPASRLSKTFYVDLGNTDYSIGLNLIDQSESRLDALNSVESKLISDVVSSLRQIWTDSWGPRMEDYLRGALTVLIAANQMLQREHAWLLFARRFVDTAQKYLRATAPAERHSAYASLRAVLHDFPELPPGSMQAQLLAADIRRYITSQTQTTQSSVGQDHSSYQSLPQFHDQPSVQSSDQSSGQSTNHFLNQSPRSSSQISLFKLRTHGTSSHVRFRQPNTQHTTQNATEKSSAPVVPQTPAHNGENTEHLAELADAVQHYLAQIEHITQHILRPTDYHLPQETDPFLFAYVTRLIYAPGGEPTVRHRPIQFSLLDVPALLMNERFYNLVLSLLNRNEHALAMDWFTRNVIELRRDQLNTYREYITPVITKINAFVTYVQARRILGQSESSLSIREILDSGSVLIINLASGVIGRDAADLIGSTIINQIAAHLFARQRRLDREFSTPKTRPNTLYLVVDEFQTITGGNFAMLLSETAKFGLRLIMGTQSLTLLRQRRDDRYIPWLENTRTLFCYRVSSEDAQVAKEFNLASGESSLRIAEEDLVGLPDYHCIVRAHDLQGRPSVFVVQTTQATPPQENINARIAERIVQNSIQHLHRPGYEIDVEVASFFQLQTAVSPALSSISGVEEQNYTGRVLRKRSSHPSLFKS